MDYDRVKQYCLTKPESREDYPFGPDLIVFKIKGKLFGTLGEKIGVGRINVKCDPNEAIMLRDIFHAVIPGYHANKRHWNTVILDGSIPPGEIERMIDRSYGLVVRKLKKLERQSLVLEYGEEQIYC